MASPGNHKKKARKTDALVVVRPTGAYLLDFLYFDIQFYLLLSPYLCFISFLYLDFICFRR